MKKTSITISFDEEKLSALERSLETLYTKTVPAGVREFIEMKSGNTPKPAPPVKKTKPSPSSAVGVGSQEVQNG